MQNTDETTGGTRARIDFLKTRAIGLVMANPDQHHRSSLALAVGGRKDDALRAIKELLDEGTLAGGRWKGQKIRLASRFEVGHQRPR